MAELEQKNAALTGEAVRLEENVAFLTMRLGMLERRLGRREQTDEQQDQGLAALNRDMAALKWNDAMRERQLGELRADQARRAAGPGEVRGDRRQGSEAEQPNAALDTRLDGRTAQDGQRAKSWWDWHLPLDSTNNLIVVAAGEAATVVADRIPHIAADGAGIVVGALTIGAAVVAMWRDHVKNEKEAGNGADHRPKGGEEDPGHAGAGNPRPVPGTGGADPRGWR